MFSNLNCKIKSPPSPPPSRKVREKQKESTREREREREGASVAERRWKKKRSKGVSEEEKKCFRFTAFFSLLRPQTNSPPPPAQLPSATFARSPTMASTSIFSCGSFSLVVELRKVSGQDARRFALMRVFASLPCFFHGGTCVAIKSLIFPPSRTRKSL